MTGPPVNKLYEPIGGNDDGAVQLKSLSDVAESRNAKPRVRSRIWGFLLKHMFPGREEMYCSANRTCFRPVIKQNQEDEAEKRNSVEPTTSKWQRASTQRCLLFQK